ncbi:MAG: TolC family protein, partial [bacterium]
MSLKLAIPIGIALAIAFPDGAVYGAGPVGSERPLSGKNSSAYRTPARPATDPAEPLPEPTGDLTLRNALALVLLQNPELAAFSREI